MVILKINPRIRKTKAKNLTELVNELQVSAKRTTTNGHVLHNEEPVYQQALKIRS